MRSGLRSSESVELLKSGVVVECSCSDLTRSRVSDPPPDAPPTTEPRCPLERAPDDADITTAAAEAALNWARRHWSRRATTRRDANKNRAEITPVMMATKGLIWLLDDGWGRGGSTVNKKKRKKRKKTKTKQKKKWQSLFTCKPENVWNEIHFLFALQLGENQIALVFGLRSSWYA